MPVPRPFTPSFFALALAASALPASQPAPGAPRITEALIENDREMLPGNVHALLANRVPLGPTDGGLAMERMILALKLGPESRDGLEKLLAGQQDPGSLEFHKWLTPEQFAERFGPSREDLAKVVGWLAGLRLTVDEIAAGGLSITFSGDVAAVEHAFRTTIMDFDLLGRKSQGNVNDPSIPKALAGVVGGVVSLHDVPRRAYNRGLRKLSARDAEAVAAGTPQPAWRGEANGGKGVYTRPKDWANIYNASASYDATGDGAGAVIGIVGRTNPGTSNWATFRKLMGLPLNTPDICLDGSDMFFGNYGILVYSQGALATTGGTSVSAPCFAGVMALVVQAYGRQGNGATTLYQLGAAQYSGTGPTVFHDIVEGSNDVPGLKGFAAGPGWDEVTGLGTPDVAALVNAWGGGTLRRRK